MTKRILLDIFRPRRISLGLIVFVPLIVVGVLFFSHFTRAITFEAKGASGYCIEPIPGVTTSDATSVLEYINYGTTSNLTSDQQSKVQTLLNDPKPQDSSGLVPCGRQCDDPTTAVNEAVSCNFCHIFVLFHNIVNTLLKWALLLVILLVAFGGFLIMVSGGSTGAGNMDIAGIGSLITGGGVSGLRKGKTMIFSALIGYAIMLSAWVIVNIFFSLIGVASWVGIGNWWSPDCKVPGYVQDSSGSWTYQAAPAASATSSSPAPSTSGSAAPSSPPSSSSSGSSSATSPGSSSAPSTSGSSATSAAPLDFTRLNTAILNSNTVKNLYTSTGKIGTSSGLIPLSALDTFQKAIDAATNIRDSAVNDPTSTDQATVADAAATLEAAQVTFVNSVNK